MLAIFLAHLVYFNTLIELSGKNTRDFFNGARNSYSRHVIVDRVKICRHKIYISATLPRVL